MTISITTSSQTLEQILGSANLKTINANRSLGQPFWVHITNTDEEKKVYFELGAAATTTGSTPIYESGGIAEIEVADLGKINLISETSPTDCRLSVN